MEFQKNDYLTVTIEDCGIDGEGIGKVDGFTLFVKDALIGDTVKVKLVQVKQHFAYARVEEIIRPSKIRIEPPCPYHRQCGGCQIQAMDYQAQLAFKTNKVKNSFIRIGGFTPEFVEDKMEPIVGMEHPFRYRNKAQFPFGTNKDGEMVCGFYAGRTHSIIANTDCVLGVEENETILNVILDFCKKNKVAAYNEETGKGVLRHVLIRKGFYTGQLMVCLVINHKNLPHSEALVEELVKIPGMHSISYSVNMEKTNVIMGKRIVRLWGEDTITDTIGGVSFQISPLSFYQVNPEQTQKLYNLALEYAGLTGQETVWDLYCGIGTISLFMASKAKKVYGVEIIPQAIEDARKNAKLNGFENTEFYVGKAEEVLSSFYQEAETGKDTLSAEEKQVLEEKMHPDVIMVDPPRKGCDEVCLKTMIAMAPKKIVYVSCDVATLARDARILVDAGYTIEKIRPVDQFAHTVHVETVVLLSKGMVDSRKVKVEFSLEDMDLSKFKGKATYEQIKAYVLEKTGLKVSSLYIAQIKKKCGLDVGENFNPAKSENARQPQCTPEKEDAIMQAFRHFGII